MRETRVQQYNPFLRKVAHGLDMYLGPQRSSATEDCHPEGTLIIKTRLKTKNDSIQSNYSYSCPFLHELLKVALRISKQKFMDRVGQAFKHLLPSLLENSIELGEN